MNIKLVKILHDLRINFSDVLEKNTRLDMRFLAYFVNSVPL